MESNIKHIIKNYQYFELDEAQKEMISEWASNGDEFDALKRTFIATDAIGEQEINPTIKQRLDVRFAEKYNNERLVWYNKLWLFLWPSDVSLYRRPLVQFAAICLIAVLTIPFFPNIKNQQLAMNEQEGKELVDEQKEEEELVPSKDDADNAQQEIEIGIDENNALAETSEDNVVEEPFEISEEQKGWQLKSGQEEGFDDNKFGTEGSVTQSRKDTERLDDLELAKDRDKDYSTDYLGAADSDMPVAGNIAPAGVSSDSRADSRARKKVEVEETIDLLTALY